MMYSVVNGQSMSDIQRMLKSANESVERSISPTNSNSGKSTMVTFSNTNTKTETVLISDEKWREYTLNQDYDIFRPLSPSDGVRNNPVLRIQRNNTINNLNTNRTKIRVGNY